MNQKIIFLDIDGTLTMPGSNVPPESAVSAVKKAQEKGHLVFLSTGRNYDMLSPLLTYGFDGVIASSGAYILCGDHLVYDCPMSDSEKQEVMETLAENEIFRTVECLDGAYTDEGFKVFLEQNAYENGNSELLRWRCQIEKSLNIRPMAEYRGQNIYKIVIMSPSEESVQKVQALLGGRFQFCIQEKSQHGIINGEILKKEYNKGLALELVCRKLGIDIADSIAFGDSMNDLEILETAGLSICMDNGAAPLKDIADDICPSVEENGLYKAFQKYGLL